MLLNRLLLFFIVAIISGAPAVCGAQEEDLRGLSIEELMNTEVISATQTAIPIQEAPSTVYVITGEQLQRWGIRRLSELIERIVPGAIITEDGDDLILGFRGISADNNSKVLLLLNGHYYNTQWNNGPTSEIELGLLQDIKRVEIVNGPGGALYGAGAILAVINLITKSGKDFQGVEVSANYGSGDYRKADLTIGGTVNQNTNYFVSLGGLSADGYDNNDRSPLNISRYEPGYRFYTDIDYKDFELMARFTRSERSLYNFSNPNVIPWSRYDTFFVDLKKTFETSNDLKLVVNASLDTIQTNRFDYRFGLKFRAVGEDRYGFKTTGFYQGFTNNDLVFGVEFRRDEFGDDWNGNNFNISPNSEGRIIVDPANDEHLIRTVTPYGRNVFGVFGQDILKLNEKYSMLLGLRVDGIEAPGIEEQWAITPRVALVYKPSEGTILKGMYTSGFRQPIAVLTSPDGFAFGGPGVNNIEDPEKMNSFEFSFSHNFSNNATLAANVFYNVLTNIHVLDPASLLGGNPTFFDTGRIDFVGFEAMAGIRSQKGSFFHVVHQNVQLGSRVDDIFNIHSTPDGKHVLAYPENVTKFLFDTGLTTNLNLNANAILVWNSFGLIAQNEIQDSGAYLLLNAGLVWRLNNHTKLLLHGYNLTNEQNRIPLTINNFTVLAERNFNLSIDFRF